MKKEAQQKWAAWIATVVMVPLIFGLVNQIFSALMAPLQDRFEDIPDLFVVLCSVALLHPVMMLWLKWVYHESYWQYLGARPWKLRKSFLMAQIFAIGMFILSEPVFLALNWEDISFHWQENWARWAFWFIPLLVLIFLQSSAEEMVFRGYFQSALRDLSLPKWIYMGMPALIWASIHQSMFDAWPLKIAVVAQMFVLGLIFADWAERSKSVLGPVFAHFLMNAFTMLFYGNTLRPTNFYVLQADFSDIAVVSLVFYFVLVTMAALFVYRMLYKKTGDGN